VNSPGASQSLGRNEHVFLDCGQKLPRLYCRNGRTRARSAKTVEESENCKKRGRRRERGKGNAMSDLLRREFLFSILDQFCKLGLSVGRGVRQNMVRGSLNSSREGSHCLLKGSTTLGRCAREGEVRGDQVVISWERASRSRNVTGRSLDLKEDREGLNTVERLHGRPMRLGISGRRKKAKEKKAPKGKFAASRS